jgi:parvulin-like peptidyl-prolyl isomerase
VNGAGGRVQLEAGVAPAEPEPDLAGAVHPLRGQAIDRREASQDEASRGAGGDLGFLTRAELAAAVGAPVADAAFALARVGDVAGPVESEAGFHLLELTGREPGTRRPLPEIRSQLEARMARERSTRDFDALVARLRESARVEVIEEELARLGPSSRSPAR